MVNACLSVVGVDVVPDDALVDTRSHGDITGRTDDSIAIVELATSPWKRDVTADSDVTKRDVTPAHDVTVPDRGVAWQRSRRQRAKHQGRCNTIISNHVT